MATPLRSIRIPDEVWQRAIVRAERESTTVSAVVLAALKRYGAKSATTVTPPP